MDTFKPFPETEIGQLLKKSSQCCLDVVLNPITKIVNISLSLDGFPRGIKASLVKQLITKYRMDFNILKNYRPVSNLTIVSNTIERTINAVDHNVLVSGLSGKVLK